MGIRSTGLSVDPCDRCKKGVPVPDDKQADWYRDFAKRDDQAEHMFQALQLKTDGTTVDAAFEYLCPKCQDAVATYMNKILMVKDDKKTEPKAKDDKKTEAKDKDDKKAEAKDDKKTVTVTDETQDPPADHPPNEPGVSFDEEEMFAE